MFSFKIISEKQNSNGDVIYLFRIPPNEVIYMGYILESLEGWAYYTTIDNKESIMHVEVIRDYVQDFERLLKVMNSKRLVDQ